MNQHKALAILFTLFAIGAIKETIRILTSSSADIAENRTELILIAIPLTALMLFLAIRFWKKTSAKPRF